MSSAGSAVTIGKNFGTLLVRARIVSITMRMRTRAPNFFSEI